MRDRADAPEIGRDSGGQDGEPGGRVPANGRVALIVDSPGRDLAGLALLGGELADRGAEVFLVPMNLRLRELSAIDPDLVVMNYVRKGNQEMIRRLIETGYEIGLSDTEGGVGIIGSYGNVFDHYGNVLATDRVVRDGLRFVSAWGSKVGERMVEQGWYRDDQVVVTGSPRFDFYHESLAEASADRLAEVLPADDERPMVLIIGSFPAANPLFRSADEEKAQRARNTGYDASDISELFDRDIQAMDQTVELVKRMAAAHPDGNFVFRPHPFERGDTYRELFADLDNVRVFSSGTPEAWIVKASAIVAPNDCTMAIEAAMAGVPALISSWIVPENRVEVVEQVGHGCADDAELIAKVGQIIDGSFPAMTDEHQGRLDTAIADWFHRADGRSHERLADVIATNLAPGRRSARPRRRLHYLRPEVPVLSSGGIQDRLRMLLSLPARFSFVRFGVDDSMEWDTSPKAYYGDDVQPILDGLNRHRVFGDRELSVRPAEAGRDCRFRYTGRSLVVEARPVAESPAGDAERAEVGAPS